MKEILGFLTGMIKFQEIGIAIRAGEAGAVKGEAGAGTGGVEAETGGVVIDHLVGIERGGEEMGIGIAMEIGRGGGGVGRMRWGGGGGIKGEVGVHLRGSGDW